MKRLTQLPLIIAIAAASSVASAKNMCKDFEISLNNHTGDKLLITEANLSNGQFSSMGIGSIGSQQTKVLSVAKASEDQAMEGFFKLHSASIPSKDARIKFELENTGIVCHVKNIHLDGDYTVTDVRLPGRQSFTITPK